MAMKNMMYVQLTYVISQHAVGELETLHSTEGSTAQPGIISCCTRRGGFDKGVVPYGKLRNMLARVVHLFRRVPTVCLISSQPNHLLN